MKNSVLRFLALTVLLAVCLGPCAACLGEVVSVNPLLTPPRPGSYAATQDDFLNILLLGIDFGGEDYITSGKKKKLEDCHTDGVVIVSLNRTKNTVSLISIPRDSLTYIPGVKGIYKFNAAINCADTLEEGLALACEAASWHLGGVQISKYIAVDETALVAVGDAIGGIDIEVEARFQGVDRWYNAGMQHLDGEGIMSYMRARKNIAKNYNDLGRTNRQRAVLKAIFEKIKQNPSLVTKVLSLYTGGGLNIFTNVSVLDALSIAPSLLSIDMGSIDSHVLEGKYQTFMKNFTFNDQAERCRIIREVYGLDAQPHEYVSYAYTKWLTEAGLTTAKYINIARAVLSHAGAQEGAAQHEAYLALDAATDACIAAFDLAAITTSDKDTKAMVAARNQLKPAVEKAAKAFRYPDEIKWGRSDYWYREPMINERQLNWN